MLDPLFAYAGTLRERYATIDWAATPLGEPSTWSSTLRTTVALMMRTRFPITLLWGEAHVMVYNEAYAPLIGEKHPGALGRPAADVFPEAWDQLGPMTKLAREEGFWVQDEAVPFVRRGFLEDNYFTFSYSPVVNAEGEVEGLMDIAAETTESVVTRRRLELLGRLGALLAGIENPGDLPGQALLLLREATDDIAAIDIRPVPPGLAADGRLPVAPLAPLDRVDLLVERGYGAEVDGSPRPDGPGGEANERTVALAAPYSPDPTGAVVWLPLGGGGEHGLDNAGGPVLVVAPGERLALDEAYLTFLRLMAGTITQARERAEQLALERRVAAAERAMSETLQRALLGEPATIPRVRVAVRYEPAVGLAQVGGDWYDAFVATDGALTVVIGDVSGHDQNAAAGMAQTRNFLRSLAYALPEAPAGVLDALDRTLDGLGVNTFATGVLASLSAQPDGGHRLVWCNAGHPPPVLIEPDGAARLLTTVPELLLGVTTGTERSDHAVDVAPGSTLVFYTDGLVERRHGTVDDGVRWLVQEVRDRQGLTPEQLCDHLIATAPPGIEDDIALLALQVAR